MQFWKYVKNQNNDKDLTKQLVPSEIDSSQEEKRENLESQEMKQDEHESTDIPKEKTSEPKEIESEQNKDLSSSENQTSKPQDIEQSENNPEKESETQGDENEYRQRSNSSQRENSEIKSENVKYGQEENQENSKSQEMKQDEPESTEYSEKQKNEIKKETLNNLRNVLSKIKEKKETEEQISKSEDIKEEKNHLLDSLKDIPTWENRTQGDGYAIDTKSKVDVSENTIKILISKFLTQKFCKKDSTLNARATSLEKSRGYFKWDYIGVVKDLKTHQLTKINSERYDYKPAEGKNERIPLSFYFDLSGSMKNYTGLITSIALELLKKDIKVLIGFNDKVNVQIDKIKGINGLEEITRTIESFGAFNYGNNLELDTLIKEKNIEYRIIRERLDTYLIRKKAEKCVIYSDFDQCQQLKN